MVTVKVCSAMSATPTTVGPVLNSVARRPTESATVLCAGQYRSGTHCTTLLSSHSKWPVIAGADLTALARSAAGRSATGAVNVTTIGCATPTIAPRVGRTDATANRYDWLVAARLTSAGPATTVAAVPISARTHRTAARMAPFLLIDKVVIDGRAGMMDGSTRAR